MIIEFKIASNYMLMQPRSGIKDFLYIFPTRKHDIISKNYLTDLFIRVRKNPIVELQIL
jgi:hypothetical protein